MRVTKQPITIANGGWSAAEQERGMSMRRFKPVLKMLVCVTILNLLSCTNARGQVQSPSMTVELEDLVGEIWVSELPRSLRRSDEDTEVTVKVWFDRQLLGDGGAYQRRTFEFDTVPRSVLRTHVIAALKQESERSFLRAKEKLDQLQNTGILADVRQHWIVNGFSATTRISDVGRLKEVPGVSKIFIVRKINSVKPDVISNTGQRVSPEFIFDPKRWLHPWYVHALKADRVWERFGVSGKGTLNVIHDFHFAKSPQMAESQSPIVGFNFNNGTAQICVQPESDSSRDLHGIMCAAIVCGRGSPEFRYEFGLAPSGEWAGVIARGEIEASVEWAIENAADTYSMSFSIPGLGQYRSHWRKILEHGTICGLCFVSGAGNFAKTVKVPIQMRTPEDIPQVVFAAAGVHRDLTKTSFSSQGPVLWQTEHYHEGEVKKPEVCAFNHQLPVFLANGTVRESAINGNSFAGPMFCGAIALIRSADNEIHPWRIREIITSTATDIGAPGFDSSTGHGLINCYQAVKEVLRQKAIREGRDPIQIEKESADEFFDVDRYLAELSAGLVVVDSARNPKDLETYDLRTGDIITAVEDQKVRSLAGWNERMADSQPDFIKIQIIRARKPLQLQGSIERFRNFKVKEVYAAPVFK